MKGVYLLSKISIRSPIIEQELKSGAGETQWYISPRLLGISPLVCTLNHPFKLMSYTSTVESGTPSNKPSEDSVPGAVV